MAATDRDSLDGILAALAADPDREVAEWAGRLLRGDDQPAGKGTEEDREVVTRKRTARAT